MEFAGGAAISEQLAMHSNLAVIVIPDGIITICSYSLLVEPAVGR